MFKCTFFSYFKSQNIPESIFGGSQSSQTTDFDTTPSNRSRREFLQFDNFPAARLNEKRIELQSPRKQMKRTTTISMDAQLCASPLKTRNNANETLKFRMDRGDTIEKEENENGIPIDPKVYPKRALPAGLAESFRAVFAAFLWHEGLVYDAMACSTFLKFHPSLPKRNALTFTNDAVKADPIHLSK